MRLSCRIWQLHAPPQEARAAEYSVLQDLGLVPEDDEVRRASPTPGPAVVVSTVAVVEVQHGAQQAEETVAQRTRRRWAKGVSPEPSPVRSPSPLLRRGGEPLSLKPCVWPPVLLCSFLFPFACNTNTFRTVWEGHLTLSW